MDRIELFVGSDEREQIGLHVFLESLWRHTSLPVNLTVLTKTLGEKLGIKSDGTNSFSKLRFAVPYLCGFEGFAIFADGVDMMLRSDLAELWSLRDTNQALQCVMHAYKTKHPRKYVGTVLEANNESYPRKQWSSVVLWNNKHHVHLTPSYIADSPGSHLHRFEWTQDIGSLPAEWNHLVGEQVYNPDTKLAHFTLGLPGFEHYRRSDYHQEWTAHLKNAARGLQYLGR